MALDHERAHAKTGEADRGDQSGRTGTDHEDGHVQGRCRGGVSMRSMVRSFSSDNVSCRYGRTICPMK